MSSRPSYFLFTKWTKGESVERSVRSKPTASKERNGDDGATGYQEGSGDTRNGEDYGYGYSYGYGHGTGEMNYGRQMHGSVDQSASGFTRQANKRDSFNEMLSGRDMHTQVGQNPFLAGENYLNHLKIQENFLRPQNTAAIEPKKDS